MPLDGEQFKNTMSRWASGVTVVTTVHEGQYAGLTASSFTSVSLDPPLVLVCVREGLESHTAITGGGVFAVNFLRASQQDLGMRFAGMLPDVQDRFAGLALQTAETGSPLLADVLGWLDCRVVDAHTAGDHTIFIGEVLAADAGPDGEPLGYFNRNWGTFAPLP